MSMQLKIKQLIIESLNLEEITPDEIDTDAQLFGEGLGLVSLFEIDPEQIKPESRLYEDLDLDSIDAVDMIVYLQKKTGKKIKPELFKSVCTVQDVTDVLVQLFNEPKEQ